MKPNKPSPDFPLTPHSSGKWCKRIDGKIRYFGRWDDPDGALAEYEAYRKLQVPEILTGPIVVFELCEKFLAAKDALRMAGDLSNRSYEDYRRIVDRMLPVLGANTAVRSLRPADFQALRREFETTLGPVALGNAVQRVRTVFKWGTQSRLFEAVAFGPDFRKPSASAVRRARRGKPKKLFTREQILTLLPECGVHLRAMVLLGINCGFGNSDCGTLPRTAIDWDRGWIEYERPKTGVERRCPLWPETVDNLRESLQWRPKPEKDCEDLFFLLPWGRPWTEDTTSAQNQVTLRTKGALLRAGIQTGSFYWLRHTFETVASSTLDQQAINCIMGHADGSMAAVYRETISDGRLQAVVDHVRDWIFR